MSITHAGFNFGGSDLHGLIVPLAQYVPLVDTSQWFGVQGEAQIVAPPAGRDLGCEYTLGDFVSPDAIETVLRGIDAQVGLLTGTISLSTMTSVWGNCTFMGFEREAPWLDGGVHGWTCQGRLLWRQRLRD